jgi:hypothetical protein
MSRSAVRHPRALARAWPVRLLAAAGAALALAGRPAAEPGPRPGSWLGCEVALGPGAVGGVRYRAGAGGGTAGGLTVAVRLEPAAAGGPPLAAGDRLPVAITVGAAPPYLAGLVGLGWSGSALEGSPPRSRPASPPSRPGRRSRSAAGPARSGPARPGADGSRSRPAGRGGSGRGRRPAARGGLGAGHAIGQQLEDRGRAVGEPAGSAKFI